MTKILSTITVASTLFSLLLPLAASAQSGEPLCYITTSRGNTFNLDSLCMGGESQANQLKNTTQSGLYLQSVTSRFKRDYSGYKRVISGDVVNSTRDLHILAKLEYQLYTLNSGKLVRKESGSESLATGYGIRAGESMSFNFEVPDSFYVITMKLKSDKFSGEPVCFANTQEKEKYCQQLTREVRSL
jgi:hypothetical protein